MTKREEEKHKLLDLELQPKSIIKEYKNGVTKWSSFTHNKVET